MRSSIRQQGMFARPAIKRNSIVRGLTFFAIVATVISFAPTASSADAVDACGVEWPAPGTEFMKNAAINSPQNEVANQLENCTTGAYFKNYNDGTGARDLRYQSPKFVHEDLSGNTATKGYIESADVVIDSRDNAYDPVNPNDQEMSRRNYEGTGYYSDEAVSYKQSGHWGIQTSNWSESGVTYRITVNGKYKYDQTQPTGFGEADAECATGFAPGDDPEWGLTTTNTATTWKDKFIPPQYGYVFKDKHQNITGDFTEEKIFGDSWQAHRFDYDFVVNKGTPLEQKALSDDGFDLEFGWARGPVEWTALEKNAKGKLYASGGPCSSINTYSYDFVGTGRPIHFVLGDFVRYGEWDNCGTLSIKISRSTTGYVDPVNPPYGMDACHWVPDYSARTIFMKDLNNKNMSHPYYFDPINYTTNDGWFDPQRGVTATAKVTWGNLGSGPHSVTAAVAKDGTFCTNVVSLGALDLGKDDCDKQGIQRLFDSNPSCPLFGPCNTGAGGFVWTVQLNEEAQNKLCEDGYCSIPYYCRVKPDEMRGTIVVNQTA